MIINRKLNMRKQIVSLIGILVAASSLFVSCDNKSHQHMGTFQFDSLAINQTEHLFGDTAKPSCNLTVNFAFVQQADEEKLKDSVNAFIQAACFGEEYAYMGTKEALEAFKNKYIQTYRNDLEPLYAKDVKEAGAEQREIGAWYSYYKGVEGHVQRYYNHLLVYRINYNEYTGGAHGIYMTTYLNLDIRTLQPVRLDDLLIPEYEEQLTDLLWNQLMADNRVATHEELEEMGFASTGELKPTENFCLGEEGITFYYNVYEIAPYSMGPTAITLPYEMLVHLMNDTLEVIK